MATSESPEKVSRPPRPQVSLETVRFYRIKNEAYKSLESALSHDQRSNYDVAIPLYQQGLSTTLEALAISCTDSSTLDSVAAEKCKLEYLRPLVQRRIQTLSLIQSASAANDAAANPRLYPSLEWEKVDSEFVALAEVVLNLNSEVVVATPQLDEGNAMELLRIDDAVQLYNVGPDESVSSLSEPVSMSIFRFRETSPSDGTDGFMAFLQVGDWTYPLSSDSSPALHTRNDWYMFPDVTQEEGHYVGIIIAETVPTDVRDEFRRLLTSLTALKEETASQPEGEDGVDHVPPPKTIGDQLAVGGQRISEGFGKVAAFGSDVIAKGTDYVISKTQPAGGDVLHVAPRTRAVFETTKNISGFAVKVSSALVHGVGSAGKRLVYAFMNKKEGGKSESRSLLRGGIQGFAFAFDALENAGKTLARALGGGTVRVIRHKYGDDAAELAATVAETTGNVATTAINVHGLGPKSIAKRVIKDAAKETLKNVVT